MSSIPEMSSQPLQAEQADPLRYETQIIKASLQSTYGEDVRVVELENGSATFSKDRWKQVLKDQCKFRGKELENATELMAQFSQGIQDTHDYHATERGVLFPLPQIYFFESNKGSVVQIGIEQSVAVNLRYLQLAAKQDLHKKEEFTHPKTHALVMRSSYAERFYLNGIEECDHVAFCEENPDYIHVSEEDSDRANRSVDYDSTEPEFRWLKTGIVIARKNGMRTIAEILRQRYENAKKVRLGKPYIEKSFPLWGYYPEPVRISGRRQAPILTWQTISGKRYYHDIQNNIWIVQGNGRQLVPKDTDNEDFNTAIAYYYDIDKNPEVRCFYDTFMTSDNLDQTAIAA